ncbi:unnamed protein product [Trichobilharzia szidati]|nr:unnamed protein product [Trichobilharzia szidati]
MTVESNLRKCTKTPYSVVTRGRNNSGTSTPSRIPILNTRVHLACSDTTPTLPQSSTETAEAVPGGHDTTPVAIGSQCATHSKTKKKHSRRHKTSEASSGKGDDCQACSVIVSKTDSAYECNFRERLVHCRCDNGAPKPYY